MRWYWRAQDALAAVEPSDQVVIGSGARAAARAWFAFPRAADHLAPLSQPPPNIINEEPASVPIYTATERHRLRRPALQRRWVLPDIRLRPMSPCRERREAAPAGSQRAGAASRPRRIERCLDTDVFLLVRGFTSAAEDQALAEFLCSVPLQPEGRVRSGQFAFRRLHIDGHDVVGRLEAAAGEPIWRDGRIGKGAAIPAPLAALRDGIVAAIDREGWWSLLEAQPQAMTSVYVDRYEAGGSFVAHTDRDFYGPVVAGVSVGPGEARISFTCTGAPAKRVLLPPRSLYLFAGRLRHPPWQHSIDDVTGLRFGVTFRSADRHSGYEDVHAKSRDR